MISCLSIDGLFYQTIFFTLEYLPFVVVFNRFGTDVMVTVAKSLDVSVPFFFSILFCARSLGVSYFTALTILHFQINQL